MTIDVYKRQALEVQRKNGTEYEDTNVTTISELLHSSLTVKDIPAKEIQDNDYCVHVKLPKSFDVLNDELKMCIRDRVKGSDMKTGDLCGFYWQNKLLLKRIIGLPGDVIELDEDGVVTVNGQTPVSYTHLCC